MLCTLPTQRHPVYSPPGTWSDLEMSDLHTTCSAETFSARAQVCCAVGPPTHTEKSCISIIKPRKTLVFNSYTSTSPRTLDGIRNVWSSVLSERNAARKSMSWSSGDLWLMRSSFRHRTNKKRRSNTHLDVSQNLSLSGRLGGTNSSVPPDSVSEDQGRKCCCMYISELLH